MKNLDGLRADNILHNFSNYILRLKDSFVLQTELIYFLIGIAVLFVLVIVARKIFSIKKAMDEQSMLLELTPPSFTEQESYTTDQLFSVIHALGNQRSFKDRLLGLKPRFSLEIVSTQNQGIRYLVRTSPKQVNTLKRSLFSYLPHLIVKTANEYLPEDDENFKGHLYKILEFKLAKHFAFSLRKQSELEKHDPIAYITGMMTKLSPDELISLQVVLTPSKKNDTKKIQKLLSANGNVVKYLRTPGFVKWLLFNNYSVPYTKSPSEQEAVRLIDTKINQQLFESTIRLLIVSKDKEDLTEREQGFKSSISTFSSNGYQSITTKRYLNVNRVRKLLFYSFKKRLLSFTGTSVLSISEVSGIYHFPYTSMTKTEDLVKTHSKTLPAPLSLKNGAVKDVTFAKNSYGGSETEIGLTKEERARHMYIIGATGTGKSTMALSMASQDIKDGKGLAVVDPHGDLAEALLNIIPKSREDDLIYFNPDDIKYPIGLNLLELTPGLDEDKLLREKELITESVISLFRKVFSEVWSAHAHRLEYTLRNTIQTALTIENPTLFTVYELLNNPDFQKKVTGNLEDENLKNFWKYEFGKAGDFQKVKMVGPVTARIGRFLFSPSAKRILEQPKSTINFDKIMDEGKILICNLSKGKLGEDNSEVLGIMILTKIQLTALKRARQESTNRKPFYLYVDEFQNFATPSFVQMLSEARKYGLVLTMVEQSTSQQKDRNLVNVLLANVGTVVTFRSANPEDEKLMLPQFVPYVDRGEIANLPTYNFYMKIGALNPVEPFSGETMPLNFKTDKAKIERLTQLSRDKNAIVYVKPQVVKKVVNLQDSEVSEGNQSQSIATLV